MFMNASNVMSLDKILVKIICFCIIKSKPKIKHIDLSCNEFFCCRQPYNVLNVCLRGLKL